MVVGDDGKVAQRLVTTAERVGPLWRIATGLKADDKVLVDGVQKVRPGMQVNAKVVAVDADKAEPGKDGPKDDKEATKPTTPEGKK
jgi:hypothetical protein